jgi:hypothetical protein
MLATGFESHEWLGASGVPISARIAVVNTARGTRAVVVVAKCAPVAACFRFQIYPTCYIYKHLYAVLHHSYLMSPSIR